MHSEISPRVDREDQHIRITWLWPDPAALENLLCHLKELSTSPVLIDEKLRLDIEAKGVVWMPLDRETPATLTLHDAGHKPASRLCARQSFLLIVRTRHIVTLAQPSDRTLRTSSAGYSDVPAYS